MMVAGDRADRPGAAASGSTAKTGSTAAADTESPLFRLRLYIAGTLPNSLQAQENLRSICDAHVPGRYTLEVVDFLAEPRRALEDGVLVTPTLLRLAPEPQRVVVGSLSDRDAVANALGLSSDT
jgi:circadian clock protein KaiB